VHWAVTQTIDTQADKSSVAGVGQRETKAASWTSFGALMQQQILPGRDSWTTEAGGFPPGKTIRGEVAHGSAVEPGAAAEAKASAMVPRSELSPILPAGNAARDFQEDENAVSAPAASATDRNTVSASPSAPAVASAPAQPASQPLATSPPVAVDGVVAPGAAGAREGLTEGSRMVIEATGSRTEETAARATVSPGTGSSASSRAGRLDQRPRTATFTEAGTSHGMESPRRVPPEISAGSAPQNSGVSGPSEIAARQDTESNRGADHTVSGVTADSAPERHLVSGPSATAGKPGAGISRAADSTGSGVVAAPAELSRAVAGPSEAAGKPRAESRGAADPILASGAASSAQSSLMAVRSETAGKQNTEASRGPGSSGNGASAASPVAKAASGQGAPSDSGVADTDAPTGGRATPSLNAFLSGEPAKQPISPMTGKEARGHEGNPTDSPGATPVPGAVGVQPHAGAGTNEGGESIGATVSGKAAPGIRIAAEPTRTQVPGHSAESSIASGAANTATATPAVGSAQAHGENIPGTPPNLPAPPGTVPAMHTVGDLTTPRPSANHLPASAPFDRMDSAAVPQTMESTPQRLSVGVQSPELGWVEVRTSRDAGQLSATLATGSVESHSALSTQLPSVRDYLAEHHVHVDTLGSERFSQPSGGGQEGFSGESHPGHSAQQRQFYEETSAPATSASDADPDPVSYISVRV